MHLNSTGHQHHDAHAHHLNHDHHVGHDPQQFRDKFWFSLLLTLPVALWSDHLQMLLGYHAPSFAGASWIPAGVSTILFFYGGFVFLQGAWQELMAKRPGMMTLIALAISVAFSFSWVVQWGWIVASPLWWELATLVTIMLLGHWIEMRAVTQAQGALHLLAKLLPDTATRLTPQGEAVVAVTTLQVGDMLLVHPGERVAADGVVRQGKSNLNESMLTGESQPVQKQPGDSVIAATINGEGALHIEVTGTGNQTKLSGIMRLVAEAQHSKSRVQHLADRAARLLTVVAMVSGVLTLVIWQLLGADIEFSIVRVVTVLLIACPHALGLAVPLVVAISTTMAAKQGLLIRDRRGLEEARNVDTIIFDKTGTLTLGEFRVVQMAVADGLTEDEALGIAAGVEFASEHPMARGLVKTALARQLDMPNADDMRALVGRGVTASIAGQTYAVGGAALLEQEKVLLPAMFHDVVSVAGHQGQTAIYLLTHGQVIAVFVMADVIRDTSRAAIRALHARGLEVVMLTGDTPAVAETVAAALGIDRVFAGVLPEDKAAKVQAMQAQGKKVAMVGDGVNDAPALAMADIGIAMGAGTDVAVEAGHIVLVRSDPNDIPKIIALSRATYRKMLQNLWWAAGYNLLAIPLAAGVFSSWGIVLTPAVGAVLMSASTLVVALNAQLLKQTRLSMP